LSSTISLCHLGGFVTDTIRLIRSYTLDKWTEKHATYIELGGNKRARDFFGLGDADVALGDVDRWSTPKASEYRAMLKSDVYKKLGHAMSSSWRSNDGDMS